MAKIHPTIVIPEGGAMPTLGTLMGTRSTFSPSDEEEHTVPPSMFGDEITEIARDFYDRHVAPQNRTAYFLTPPDKK